MIQKIHPLTNSPDICQTSIALLKDKAAHYLRKNYDANEVWVPDEAVMYPETSKAVDAVLLGGILERFLETGNWPQGQYNLWTCSAAARDILIQLLKFDSSEVGLISRYELYPAKKNISEDQDLNNRDFVFAGRLSPTKNIECLLTTVSLLQTLHKKNVGLHLFGEFDEMYSADRGRWEVNNYEDQIKTLVKKLKWTKEPIFHGKKSSSEWVQEPFENPVLINFSTFMCEDFDMSLAQVQQQGWSSVITDWGGHRDQQFNLNLFVPWKMVGRSDESAQVIELKSKILANYLATHKLSQNVADPIEDLIPLPISNSRLNQLRSDLLKSLGPEAYTFQKNGIAGLADTIAGQKFFSIYRSLFGASLNNQKIILTNDLNDKKDSLNQKIQKTTLNLLEVVQNPTLISIREVLWPENLPLLSSAQEIHFSFYDASLEKLVKSILALVPETCAVKIHQSDCEIKKIDSRLQIIGASTIG